MSKEEIDRQMDDWAQRYEARRTFRQGRRGKPMTTWVCKDCRSVNSSIAESCALCGGQLRDET